MVSLPFSALSRRQLLRTGVVAGAAGVLAGCRSPRRDATFVTPDGPQVRAAEAARHPGTVREVRLTASADTVDIGGRTVATWTYGGRLPGSPIRLTAGEVLRATLDNRLPGPTSIHWHGLALRNDADGVPDVTQPAVAAGGEKMYEFTASQPGTYWFHPHQGVQLDRGLYAPLIVEDPHEPLGYDDEWVVVLDDWLDGVDGTPDDVLAELEHGMPSGGAMPSMSGMDMGGMDMGGHTLMGAGSDLLGGDAGDVKYPYFLINGRRADAPAGYHGKPGTRLRLRIINAGADTAFRVALGGHRLTVTHTDGYPVQPVQADALLIGMGERYDAIVTLEHGVFPLVAAAEGKNAIAMAVIRTGSGTAPAATTRPKELHGNVVGAGDLHPDEAVRLPDRPADRTIKLELTGGMDRYNWAVNGKPYDPATITPVRAGERVRIDYVNTTTMWHPMHLHGHTFAAGPAGVRKDTAIVLPKQTLTTVFDAVNPGIWMIHCHNVYHAEAGMMTLLGYLT
ncbi:multicopper oxidase family protein [Actinoplanes subtropicus]|uniref:multicopper oxidase family protein n=1 Tax=Actinoplanes subtropicus TaxID=543632 RepID=UPI0004C3888B|nr:multicopper oxidase family protein [Actinoplanes subtropicus]